MGFNGFQVLRSERDVRLWLKLFELGDQGLRIQTSVASLILVNFQWALRILSFES